MEKLDRRRFLETVGAGLTAALVSPAAASIEAAPLPRRPLGKTGVDVSALAFGGGSHFLSRIGGDEAKAEQLLLRALELGINYFDTAASYTFRPHQRLSEQIFGRVLSPHRARVFLATKTEARDRDGALRSVETSLKLLRTDHLDLVQMHSLQSLAELDAVSNGAMPALRRLQDEKVVRFVGATGHYDPAVLGQAVQRFELDTLLMSLNAAQASNPYSMSPGQPLAGFEREALPAARKKGVAVIAMKVMGQGALVGAGPDRARADELIRYALSLPVASVDIAHTSLEMLEANVAAARSFRPMDAQEMAALRWRLQGAAPAWARFLRDHDDCQV
jgi:aryl-alcohol dehydrogenase-like predicted oxidoreductase